MTRNIRIKEKASDNLTCCFRISIRAPGQCIQPPGWADETSNKAATETSLMCDVRGR